jgi:hypothetical protein
MVRVADNAGGLQMDIDLTKLTVKELKTLLGNCQRLGRVASVKAVLDEMQRRGVATRREYRTLKWNADSVRETMEPFKNVAATVRDNQRTTFTDAGGLRIGRSKDDLERVWIDTYSGIKTDAINAVFVCYIKRPGDEPEFQLRINGVLAGSYNADQLNEALSEWQAIAARAAR